MATNAHCGQAINASLTLNGDLTCSSGVGLIVSGNSVVLNLNGFAVINSASGSVGVIVSGSHDTVEKGTVTFWSGDGIAVGSVLSESVPLSNVITNVFSTYNGDSGFEDGGGEHDRLQQHCSFNRALLGQFGSGHESGIYARGNGGTYKADHRLDNFFSGVFLDIPTRHHRNRQSRSWRSRTWLSGCTRAQLDARGSG